MAGNDANYVSSTTASSDGNGNRTQRPSPTSNGNGVGTVSVAKTGRVNTLKEERVRDQSQVNDVFPYGYTRNNDGAAKPRSTNASQNLRGTTASRASNGNGTAVDQKTIAERFLAERVAEREDFEKRKILEMQ